MSAYYNEFDPFAANWLRELIKDGLIADGEVDERSITDVDATDLVEFTQCHFFAGIGGWSYALRLAGWGDDRPVWTGSPPCQPFSVAGKRKGKDDERHLWPHFFDLIRECQPPTVFGEQVASAIRDGWFDDLQTDMERENYATGMVVLPACSVGAPHKRDRLFFVADSRSERLEGHWGSQQVNGTEGWEEPIGLRSESGADGSVAHTECQQCGSGGVQGHGEAEETSCDSAEQSSRGGNSCWEDSHLVYCRDDKCRLIPTEPAFLTLLLNGLSIRMGFSRYESGEINAKKSETDPIKKMQALQHSDDAQENQRKTGRFNCVQEKGLLQQSLYGEGLRGSDKGTIGAIQQETSGKTSKGLLRAMWRDIESSRSSQGLQSDEQQQREFADFMLSLSSAATQATREGSEAAEILQRMWERSQEAGVLPEALSAIEEVWESAINESEDGITHLQACGRYFRLQSRFPLTSDKVPNRVGILRGAGNAIVPQVAAEVIRSVM